MQSYLYYLWALTMTMSVFLMPSSTLGHLGSALRTGSGTLTKLRLGDNVIFCTFSDLGEVKPPILSHVRVSREPQTNQGLVMIRNDLLDGSGDPDQAHTTKIKSPSYQHKILQFHSNGQTSSDQGYDMFPSKSVTNQYGSKGLLPMYPVASKFGKVDIRLLRGTSGGDSEDDSNDANDSWERQTQNINWEPSLLPESDQPTFTPLIGARALSNIPKFFQHLRENIRAIQQSDDQLDPVPPVASPQTLYLLSPESSEDQDVDKSRESQEDIKIATPTRRGYSSNSEPSNVVAQHTLGKQISNDADRVSREPDDKELLQFLGQRRYSYPMANNYNPAWLFTNLGLGKRSIFPRGTARHEHVVRTNWA